MIKGVIFDLDGVYFKNGKENFIKNIVALGVKEDEVKRIFLKSKEMSDYKEGKISGKTYWEWAIKEWRLKLKPEQLVKILQKGYKLNEKALPLMKKLKLKGIKSIICTNNFKERIECLDEKFNFIKDFDYSLISYEYGLLKPNLFNKIEYITGMKPQEILILDDRKDLIDEAVKMGFNASLCEDPNKVEEYLEKFKVI